jgi:outer membrane receptor protein involved in Fe transport
MFFIGSVIVAQTSITGMINEDDTGQPIPGVNIKVVGQSIGTTTDFDGKFSLLVNQNPPFSIQISLIGYTSSTIEISQNNQIVNLVLKESTTALDEIVISASRTPERIFESPVTIEKLGAAEIRSTASPSFYAGIESLKGVQINNGGILLKQISTRGFSTVYNEGFLQLVDMMDNSAPGLNFPLGNLLGINELDIKSIELMPGAASALYGANAIKGILFMSSKNPFDTPGVSAYVKTGTTNQDAGGSNPFTDFGFRLAHVFSDKFAAKVSFSMAEATDWQATDYTDINDASKSPSAIDYDGTNIYGEQSSNLNTVFLGALGLSPTTQPFIPLVASNPNYFGATPVVSTGYREVDLTDYNAKSKKFDAALHYRFSEDVELSFNSKVGSGNTILHATNRNILNGFEVQQHKIELNTKNFNFRSYATIEDTGKTHDGSALAGRIANAQPGGIASGWYGTYFQTYLGVIGSQIAAVPVIGPALAATPGFPVTAIIGHQANQLAQFGFPAGPNMSIDQLPGVDTGIAHTMARAAANGNMLVPGSPEFNSAYDEAVSKAISEGGAVIQDNSKSYSFEGDYNLRDLIDYGDVIVGASFRKFSLDSEGTLFTDYDQPIRYSEYGMYAQLVKGMDKLKFTGSLRYDKSEFFDGSFTPRVALLLDLTEDQNLRVSFQTGFRNPSSQDQYIGLDVSSAVLMGSSPDNVERFLMDLLGNDGQTYSVSGNQVFTNSYSLSSVQSGAPALASLKNVVPEQVNSFEFGYRLNRQSVSIDLNGYFSKYTDFIAGQNVVVPLDGQPSSLGTGLFRIFQVDGNTEEIVNTYGMNLGINTRVFDKLKLGFVYEYNKLDFNRASAPDFEPGFNTPENTLKFSIGIPEIMKQLSISMNVRWHDSYLYESTFVDRMIPSNTVLNAQANYSMPKYKSVLKIGITNLFGDDYLQIPGSGLIGQQSYISLTVNP